MRRRIYCGAGHFEIMPWAELPAHGGNDGTPQEFANHGLALAFLRQCLTDGMGLDALRRLWREADCSSDCVYLDDRAMLTQLAGYLVTRRVVVLALPEPHINMGSSPPTPQPTPPRPTPTPPSERRSWIEIELVDEDGKPVAGERYRVRLPDGTVKENFLDGRGFARIESPVPGNCQISFPRRDGADWARG